MQPLLVAKANPRTQRCAVSRASSRRAGSCDQSSWPRSCTPAGGPRRAAANDRIRCRNPGERPGLSLETLLRAAENRPHRSRVLAALGFACALALLVAAAWPGAAGSAPARVVVLGKTDSTPPPSCPGKIVNNVEVIPCRVEGHVTGFQAIAGGVPRPYEAPFDGKIVAWSITLGAPFAHGHRQDDRRGRLLQRIPRQAVAGADRRPAPGRRLEAAQVHARPPEPAARSSTPTSAAPWSSPSTIRSASCRARSSP